MTVKVHSDFETRSTVDIKTAGADVYAEHPSTDILCMGYAFDDEEPQSWAPGDPLPKRLFAALEAGAKFVAHNAYFELVIWHEIAMRLYGFPPLSPDQCIDTMAICYAHALPGSLAAAGPAIGLATGKDDEGRRVMLKLCKPRKAHEDGTVEWWEKDDYPELYERLYETCKKDVRDEREIEKRLPALKASEQELWEVDFRINRRGVPIDLVSVRRALALVEREAREGNAELRRITGGAVPAATNVLKLGAWLRKEFGLPVTSLTKADIFELLNMDGLPNAARQALSIRQSVGKTSVRKLQAALECTSPDGRARGLHQFHAASTGRWAGRRIQTQNLPRPAKDVDVDWCLDMLEREDAYEAISLVHGGVTVPLSSSLRGMIEAPEGMRLIAGDFSGIEACVLPWLAGEQWKLDAIRAVHRGEGKDMYLVAAEGIFGDRIDDKGDPRRQVGKVSELALGYQGGAGAFASMAAGYGIDVEEILPLVWPSSSRERRKAALLSWRSRGKAAGLMSHRAWVAAELVKIPWRERHPATAAFWRDMEDAAVHAVERPGSITQAGAHIAFRKAGSFLFMRLPSGRCLAYPYPQLVRREMPWKNDDGSPATKIALTYFSKIDENRKKKIVPDRKNGSRWARVATYGGELAENADQAVARDLLASAIKRLEAAEYKTVMHTHDEVVCLVPEGEGTLAELLKIMCVLPAWAKGLPVAADGWEGARYRK
ncbi:MAG: hypothetical protein Q8P46_06810 [Hyphomicrobiales bacterium]|nr:hypothetical protein [Hyphomicrobiales bacterium]